MFAAVFRLLRLFFWPIVTTSSWVERLVARAKRAKKQTSRTSLSLFLSFGTTHNQSSPTADFLPVHKIWNAALVQQVLQKCEITWKSVLVSGLRKFPDVGKKYSDFNRIATNNLADVRCELRKKNARRKLYCTQGTENAICIAENMQKMRRVVLYSRCERCVPFAAFAPAAQTI